MSPEQRLRADAARNRDRILDAAVDVFAQHGVQADIATVARRAEVGNATVFRRFPTKEDLVAAVCVEGLRRQCEAARAVVEGTAGDAHRVLAALLETALADRVRNRCVAEAVPGRVLGHPEVRELHTELVGVIEGVLARGRADGSIRDDVTVPDLALLLAAVASRSWGVDDDAWRRSLQIVLDGLRPGGTPLTGAAPSWDMLAAAPADHCR